ncbi:MAG: 2-phosphosulfolactate phosphatase [Synergistetes bacterium]|nr:2-phosphosulfolactate phosphatase [Synergistota bacterium]MCX8127323.1 2-phosphosulfolactate phosphatase [Synergistota bacterium]MDW8191790.1 2-phosphosulfolactate phosphatase [Synergistota bacterium]
MKIYVLSSISERLPGEKFLWIALDVIRATSTIVTFFACGGKHLYLTSSIREARIIKKGNPQVLLMGERGGVKIAGFDFDNSPTEIMENSSLIRGKNAVLTTTNGTKLLRKILKGGQDAIVGSILNLDAAVKFALEVFSKGGFNGIGIACAGKEGNLVSDDFYCAGVIVSRIRELIGSVIELNDAACIAFNWASHNDALDVFLRSASGKNAIKHGKYRDVEFCSKFNLFDLVPIATGKGEVILKNVTLAGL